MSFFSVVIICEVCLDINAFMPTIGYSAAGERIVEHAAIAERDIVAEGSAVTFFIVIPILHAVCPVT